MTESELREKIAGFLENEFFEAHLRSKDHRRLRRVRDIQKSGRLLHIIHNLFANGFLQEVNCDEYAARAAQPVL